MKKHSLFVLVLSFLLTCPGTTARAAGGDAVEMTSSGMINWTSGEIFATGIGAPPSQPMNAAQARAMTERAAYVVALRNLLEVVKGVRVDSESTVENFIVKSDVIRTRVDGIVKGARIVKTRYLSDGSVEIQVAMPLRGALMDAVLPGDFGKPGGATVAPQPVPLGQKPPQTYQPQPAPEKPEPVKPSVPETPSPAPPEAKPEPPQPAPPQAEKPTTEFKGGVATGLVIDGKGLNLRPALVPKILDPQGREIYVGQVATRTNAMEQGVAGYARDVNAAANNFRVTDNPAIIKGIRSAGTARTDIIVNEGDAKTLQLLSTKGNFLQYCRVIIVY